MENLDTTLPAIDPAQTATDALTLPDVPADIMADVVAAGFHSPSGAPLIETPLIDADIVAIAAQNQTRPDLTPAEVVIEIEFHNQLAGIRPAAE